MLRDIKKLRVMKRASFFHSIESNRGKDHWKLGLQGKKKKEIYRILLHFFLYKLNRCMRLIHETFESCS